MITLCIPYYDDPHRLRGLMMNECLGMFDEIIIVDDGSPTYPAARIVKEFTEELSYIDIKVWRITEDFGFNAHGARNLAATVAKGDWLLFLDIDMEPDAGFVSDLFERVENAPEDEFIVCNLLGDDPGNIFALRALDFWRAGGYDEELRGFHMGDKLFRERLDSFCDPVLMDSPLKCNRMGRQVRVDNEITGTVYPDERTVVQRSMVHVQPYLDLIEERNQRPETWDKIPKLNFDYTREL